MSPQQQPTLEELMRRFNVQPKHREHLKPDRPLPLRLMAVRGLAGLPPKTQLVVQYLSAAGLLGDEEQLRDAGRNSLLKIPTALLLNAVDERTHPKILEFLTLERPVDSDFDEYVSMRSQLNENTAMVLAARAEYRVLEIVTNNQEMLLCYPRVLRAIAKNPSSTAAMVERVESFLRLNGEIVSFDEPEDRPGHQELPAVDELQSDYAGVSEALKGWMAEHPLYEILALLGVGLRAEYFWGSEQIIEADRLAVEQAEAAARPVPVPAHAQAGDGVLSNFEFGVEDDSDLFDEALVKEGAEEEEDKIEGATLKSKIRDMSTGAKIKLAYTGNAETRMILIKDSNKVIAEAVMKSGRLSDREVAKVAAMRSVADDVIRAVARNKQWTRIYQVKLALVKNPKTPVAISSKLLRMVNARDLKLLSKNRNINPTVTIMAKRMVKAKEERTS